MRQELGQPKTRNANHQTGKLEKSTSRTPMPQTVNYIELKASSQSNEPENSTNNSSTDDGAVAQFASNGIGPKQPHHSFAESMIH